MHKYLLIFAVLTITLAACRVESNVVLDIREDGSASVTTEVGFDEEFRNIVEGIGVVPEEVLSELPSFGGDDFTSFQRTEGDLTFFGVTSEIDDLSSYAFGGSGRDIFADFSYEFDGSTARLTATLNAAEFGAAGGDLPIDPSQISEGLISANVIVTMPGRVKEHNADEVRSDGTLVWNVSLTGSTTISATSDSREATATWTWWILGGTLIVIGAAGVTATLRRRTKEEEAVAAAAASHETSLEEVSQMSTSDDTQDPIGLDPTQTFGATSNVDVDAPETDQPETT